MNYTRSTFLSQLKMRDAESTRSVRVYPKNVEASARIQAVLFSDGYKWGDTNTVLNTTAKALIIDVMHKQLRYSYYDHETYLRDIEYSEEDGGREWSSWEDMNDIVEVPANINEDGSL